MMTLKSCRSASHGGGGGDDGVMNIADYDVYILVSGNLRCQQDWKFWAVTIGPAWIAAEIW